MHKEREYITTIHVCRQATTEKESSRCLCKTKLMNEFMRDFIKRNLPQFIDNFDVIITNEKEEKYKVMAKDAVVTVEASNYICACNGIYEYLKEYCNVQYSWCGTFSFDLKELKMLDGVFEKR